MVSPGGEEGRRWTPAQGWGLTALVCAALLLPLSAPLAVLPLAVYAGVCCLVPFFPNWSWYLPIVSRGSRSSMTVALTFDDGPDPRSTPALLGLLERHAVKATFYLLGRRAARHSELVAAILGKGHTVGNHSHSHAPTLMLRSKGHLSADILATQQLLAGHGIRPLTFRPPVGITNPLLKSVLTRQNLFAVNFSCRAYDLGNRRLDGLAAKLLERVRPGDILLLHDTVPPRAGDADVKRWLLEVDRLLAGLGDKGLTVVPLADLIGREVMVYAEASAASALRQQRGSEAR
jgi:peptidoglycan/xylan/chitin deacetylase (PgdA/CDA1 family)